MKPEELVGAVVRIIGICLSVCSLFDLGGALARWLGVPLDPRYSYLTDIWAACQYGVGAAILLLFADRIVRLVYRR